MKARVVYQDRVMRTKKKWIEINNTQSANDDRNWVLMFREKRRRKIKCDEVDEASKSDFYFPTALGLFRMNSSSVFIIVPSLCTISDCCWVKISPKNWHNIQKRFNDVT